MTPEEHDATLQAQLASPDTRRKAFEAMVKEQAPALYRHIRRLVLTHDDTDDVLQNTLLKAWCALDTFRGESKLSTWLFRIAYNESLTFLAQRQRNQELSLDEESEAARTLEGDPYFDGDETQIMLQQAIGTLPQKQRAVFNLRYFEEMPYAEMSRVLSTSEGALKASYHHAVKKIETYFNERD